MARVVDPDLLQSHWRRLSAQLTTPRVKNFELVADPLDHLPFSWRLDTRLRELRSQVLAGTYRPARPQLVRSAKSIGLTRPVAFIRPQDMLLYRNIVALAENDLLRGIADWSRFGRSDTRRRSGGTASESGWFIQWLDHRGQMWIITSTYAWIVESDISNFFPSVQIDALMKHVISESRLSIETVRLLEYMLREFSPRAEYELNPVVGLPQDTVDASRILAHSFLRPVDDAFTQEGVDGRYSRYMDDIVIGANSEHDGYRLVNKLQLSLEALGLYPNRSKTRVVARTTLYRDFMKDENDYIGAQEELLKQASPVDKQDIEEHVRSFFDIPVEDRAPTWERVLRRYHTLCRSIRSESLLARAQAHITAYPGSAREILDYMSTYELAVPHIEAVTNSISQLEDLYQDVSLLALQYFAVSPSRPTPNVTRAATGWATSLLSRHGGGTSCLAAACIVVIGKFGGSAGLEMIELYLGTQTGGLGTTARAQAVITLLAVGRLSDADLTAYAVESERMRDVCEFLTACAAKDRRAIGMLIGRLNPRERRSPLMFMIPPRTMFLAGWSAISADPRLLSAGKGWEKLVRRSEGPRDIVGEMWLGLS